MAAGFWYESLQIRMNRIEPFWLSFFQSQIFWKLVSDFVMIVRIGLANPQIQIRKDLWSLIQDF